MCRRHYHDWYHSEHPRTQTVDPVAVERAVAGEALCGTRLNLRERREAMAQLNGSPASLIAARVGVSKRTVERERARRVLQDSEKQV